MNQESTIDSDFVRLENVANWLCGRGRPCRMMPTKLPGAHLPGEVAKCLDRNERLSSRSKFLKVQEVVIRDQGRTQR